MSRRLPPPASLALAALLAAVGGAPALALNKYVAIGDSISVGTSWPVTSCGGVCPVVFDCAMEPACSPTESARDDCGFVTRLDSWLGAGHYVRNEAVGGQRTAAAASAFASEMDDNCGTPGDCVAVILMHGTNDMNNGISPESARDNLAAMIAEAKSRNIDTVLMSIIRKVYDKNNPTWKAYRDLTLALATAEDLQSVDPWLTLCNSTSCFDENYWVDPPPACDQPGDPELGHLDSDGYDEITDLIQAVFPTLAPAAPTATSPTVETPLLMPDFVWEEAADARWYRLDVDGSITWWEAAAWCAGGLCTVNPGVALAGGMHTWQVQGRNLRGLGGATVSDFDVVAPAAPTALAPTGSLFESAPTYEWAESLGATEYDLEVRDGMGNLDAQATSLLADTTCSGGLCSHVEGTELTGTDDYTLEVKARSTVGDSAFGAPLPFTILDCVDPSQKDLEDYLDSGMVGTATVEHCGPLTAGALGPFEVEPGADLTIHTRDGFSSADGFTVRGSLALQTP